MESSIKTSFWLVKSKRNKQRECPIYLRINAKHSTTQIATGHFVLASNWDKSKKKVLGKSPQAIAINDYLSSLRTEVLKISNKLLIEGRPVNAHIIKKQLTGEQNSNVKLLKCFEEYLSLMKSLQGIDYAQPTVIKYKNTYTRLKEFLLHKYNRHDVFLYELDYDFMKDFIDFLKLEFVNSQTTCYKHYQRFTRVVRIFMRKGYLDHYPFEGFKITLPKKKVEFLSIDEINRIDQTDFGVARLNQIRDMFIFSCYTGLAFHEVQSLRPEHLSISEDGDWWIEIVRQKTQREFKIPLLPKAVEILKKYQTHPHCLKIGKCLPIPTNQKFNAYLKEIGDVCQIKQKMHHHLARKSFSVSVVLRNSVPIETLSLLLGHSSIKVTIDAYSAITEEKVKKDFQTLKSRLSGD